MYTVRLILSSVFKDDDIQKIIPALEDQGALAGSALREGHKDQGDWEVQWVFNTKPEISDLNAAMIERAKIQGINIPEMKEANWKVEAINENTDWLAESYAGFEPFSIGPFFIYGSHHEGEVPKGQMGIQIDAATAFGSGEHGTTKGCLQAMLDIKGRGVCPWNVLDLGTGSGILAIAAWKLWRTPILATDIQNEAVRVATHYCETNGIALGKMSVLCEQGDGVRAQIVQDRAPYELIVANILAAPLREMAEDLVKLVDDNGYVVLSGMLHEQASGLQALYEEQGLTFKKSYEVGEWSTLVLQKAAA